MFHTIPWNGTDLALAANEGFGKPCCSMLVAGRMSVSGRECRAAGGWRNHAVYQLQQFRHGILRIRSVDPLRTGKVGACCNVGVRQLRDLVSEGGVDLAHDGAGRLGLGAGLRALGVLREDRVPVGRQQDAGVVTGDLGRSGDVGRHGEAAEG